MRFIPAEALEPGMILGRDIINSSRTFMLKKGVTLIDEYIKYLNEKGYLGAYILESGFEDILPEEPVSQETIVAGIQAVEDNNIDKIVDLAKGIVAEISSIDQISIDIVDLRSFDDYTYHHSVNVAVYAVAVGSFMGLSSDELIDLCQAGLCHDLGKQKIPLEILNKPERLTNEEFEIIKSHPKASYDMIYNNSEISAVVRQAVICHHENENGSGYPFGKDGSQLPLLAKIIHAVDVYDALTSKRPYKDPYSPADAYDYLCGGKNILFNAEVIDAMRSVIPTYPTGIEVQLSDETTAIVVKQTEDPQRPVVRLKESLETIDLSDADNIGLIIISSGYYTLDYAGAVEELNEKRQRVREQSFNVMIVDDSPLNLQQTCAILSCERYHVIPVQSGIAAFNFIKAKGEPDLIIMDIEMPILSGISTATKIRDLGFKELPIIFLTSKCDRETVLECKKVNAVDYIVKPVRATYLKERVEHALGVRSDRE